MKIDLYFFCEHEVITSIEMYHDYTHMMTNKEKVLQGLVKDAKTTVARITNQESMIKEAFKGLSCKMITEDNKLKNQEDVLTELTRPSAYNFKWMTSTSVCWIHLQARSIH